MSKPGVTQPSRMAQVVEGHEYHDMGEMEFVKVDDHWYCLQEIVDMCELVSEDQLQFTPSPPSRAQ